MVRVPRSYRRAGMAGLSGSGPARDPWVRPILRPPDHLYNRLVTVDLGNDGIAPQVRFPGAQAGTVAGLATNAGAGPMVITWTANPALGSKVLVAVFGSTNVPSSVVDNGSTPSSFTQDAIVTASGHSSMIYRADNITLPAAGSYAVTVNFASSTTASGGGVAYLGVKPGGPTATNTGTATGTAVSSGAVTPAAPGALAFAVFDDHSGLNPETITLTSAGYTERFTQVNGSAFNAGGCADALLSTAAATTATWTLGDSVLWGAAIAVYDATVTSPATPNPAAEAFVGPPGGGDVWSLDQCYISTSVGQLDPAQCIVYVGPQPVAQYAVTGSLAGGSSQFGLGGINLAFGWFVWAIWTGGTPGAFGYLRVTGTKTVLSNS